MTQDSTTNPGITAGIRDPSDRVEALFARAAAIDTSINQSSEKFAASATELTDVAEELQTIIQKEKKSAMLWLIASLFLLSGYFLVCLIDAINSSGAESQFWLLPGTQVVPFMLVWSSYKSYKQNAQRNLLKDVVQRRVDVLRESQELRRILS